MRLTASKLFRQLCATFPQHHMHVLARYQVSSYLIRRFGAPRVHRHRRLLARALARMDH